MKPLAPLPGSAPDVSTRNASAEGIGNAMLVAKHAIKAQDPAFMPHMARRQVPQERMGAVYGVPVQTMAAIAPEAGNTLSRGRILPSTTNRSAGTFYEGIVDHN